MEWCTAQEIYDAYLDCRKKKRSTETCSVFEAHELPYLYNLRNSLNKQKYEIGESIAFCVTQPKLREVFAAMFRDRIVHHFLIKKLNYLFESYFIPDTYNCRVGKGTDWGVKRVMNMMEDFKDGWVLKCDIQGFFMSIHKPTLADALEKFIRERYKGDDVDLVVWLTRMIALHSPEKNCVKRGDTKLFDKLPDNKTLFKNGDDYGLAIGNLTSQIFANFYLTPLDNFLSSIPNTAYGRYVDDFVLFANTKEELKKLLPQIREIIASLGLTLHPHKVYLQPVRHGLNFIGSTIKQGRLYPGKRTVGNAFAAVRRINKLYKEGKITDYSYVSQRINSYMGFFVHKNAYAIRWRLIREIDEDLLKHFKVVNAAILKVKKQYQKRTERLKKYGTRSPHYQRLIHSKKKINTKKYIRH